jgi:hypothetical protein
MSWASRLRGSGRGRQAKEKVITAEQGGRINLGKSKAGLSFRLVEQGSQLVLELECTPIPFPHFLIRSTQPKSCLIPTPRTAPPCAYRAFWCYGPQQGQITIVAITPHP